MPWWIFVISGNLLLGAALLMDKMLLSGPIDSPRRYTMLSAVTAVFGIFMLPLALLPDPAFRIVAPPWQAVFFSGANAVIGFLGLYFLYTAVKQGDASRVGPTVGGLNAMFTVMLAAFFLGERFSLSNTLGIVLLLLGYAALIFSRGTVQELWSRTKNIVIAALCFATAAVVWKVLFGLVPFLTAQLLGVAANILVGLFLLSTMPRGEHRGLGAATVGQLSMPRRTLAFFAANKLGAAIGGLLIQFAISLTSVSLVNASEGVKYAFIFLMALGLSIWFPKFLHEDLAGTTIAAKIIGIVLVGVGLALVAQI